MEVTPAGLGMESKAPQFHGTAEMILSYVPAIPGHIEAVVTNDWCKTVTGKKMKLFQLKLLTLHNTKYSAYLSHR